MEMLAEDSTEAESVVPGGSQEAVDAVEVSLCIITRNSSTTCNVFPSTNTTTDYNNPDIYQIMS